MRLFQRLFYQPKNKERTTGERSICRLLAPSVISIFICAVCLCGASWAWFIASTSTGTTSIKTPEYRLTYQIDTDTEAAELAADGTTYSMTKNACVITLKATGTAGATGYCSIKVGDKTYYTEQIFVDGTFTFTVNAAQGTQIILTPKWGTYSGTATLHNSDVITATGSQQSNTQAPDSTVTAEPTAEPTAPTTPTTPSSTPEESETTTPQPSATAPTAPKTTDTEQTPAPETTQPEETATPAEPVTTPDTTESTTGVPDTTEQAEGSTTSAENTGTEGTN